MRTRLAVSAGVFAVCASVGSVAFAQGAPADAPPPTAPADDHALPPVAADAKPQPPPPAKASHPIRDADEGDEGDDTDENGKKKKKKDKDRARFRGGVSLFGGGYLIHGTGIGFGGFEFRLGAQIRDWVGIYAEPALLLGADRSGVVVRASVGIIPEFSVADLWFIGLGPDIYATAGATGSGYFASASYLGINGRTGFAIGSKRPGRRHSFTIAADLRLDFYKGSPAFAPALSLGYDAW